jgi:hypothetical protein
VSNATDVLDPYQAANAIYIDFEGRAHRAPALLGVFYAEGSKRPDEDRLVLRQDVVADDLSPAAGMIDLTWAGHVYHAQNGARPLRHSLHEVVRRAAAQDRLIVAWSQHDLKVALKYGRLEKADEDVFVERYRDGKSTAKGWLQATRPDVVLPHVAFCGKHQLARYFELIDFDVPERAGPKRVAMNLERVAAGLSTRGSFDRLVASQKDAWADVLLHNLYDCVGLRKVVRLAADELAGHHARARIAA